jgi:hypothetical protein
MNRTEIEHLKRQLADTRRALDELIDEAAQGATPALVAVEMLLDDTPALDLDRAELLLGIRDGLLRIRQALEAARQASPTWTADTQHEVLELVSGPVGIVTRATVDEQAAELVG